jgi:hypothetical protein
MRSTGMIGIPSGIEVRHEMDSIEFSNKYVSNSMAANQVDS